jgi:membrane protease subunit HflK
VRKKALPSEIGQLASPVLRIVDGAWQRMHWWIVLMALLYAASGITVVRPDEVGLILRWGRVVGDTPALQAHGPGLLFAFPRPIDRVGTVQVKKVSEVRIDTLTSSVATLDDEEGSAAPDTYSLDPITQGFAVTGDHNIVQVEMVARYRVRDPALWVFYGPKSEDVLRAEVTAAMIRTLGEMGVDRVLAEGRKDLITVATRRAQAGLDACHSGLELSSLELTHLGPPAALASEFDAVQSAFIGAETLKKVAQSYGESAIPQAQSDSDTAIQRAHAESARLIADANGEAAAFRALAKEYRTNPAVVRERLYRDAVETAIRGAGKVQWVPPPPPGGYKGFRISIGPATPAGRFVDDDER